MVLHSNAFTATVDLNYEVIFLATQGDLAQYEIYQRESIISCLLHNHIAAVADLVEVGVIASSAHQDVIAFAAAEGVGSSVGMNTVIAILTD